MSNQSGADRINLRLCYPPSIAQTNKFSFVDKVLLITSGTGSFGNAVMRRLLNSDIREI